MLWKTKTLHLCGTHPTYPYECIFGDKKYQFFGTLRRHTKRLTHIFPSNISLLLFPLSSSEILKLSQQNFFYNTTALFPFTFTFFFHANLSQEISIYTNFQKTLYLLSNVLYHFLAESRRSSLIYNTDVRQERHERHECNTSDTSTTQTTRVLHKRQESDTSEKF